MRVRTHWGEGSDGRDLSLLTWRPGATAVAILPGTGSVRMTERPSPIERDTCAVGVVGTTHLRAELLAKDTQDGKPITRPTQHYVCRLRESILCILSIPPGRQNHRKCPFVARGLAANLTTWYTRLRMGDAHHRRFG